MRVLIKLLASMHRCAAVLAIAVLFAATGLAQAQTATGDDSADPPSRVARLSYIAGDLGLLPAGATDWSDASVNRPLTTGDRLSSGSNARAELEFGGATLRVDDRTDLGLLNLNEQLAQIELTQGTLSLSVRHLDDGQSYEIDTPTVAVVISQPGRFRVDIDGNATRVTAFEGKATVYGENNAQRDVFAGRSYRFVDSSLAAVAISDIGGGDSFDAWVDQRDQRYAQSDSSQYVSPDVVGYQDLDQYGEWQDNSDYGAVWYPTNVAVGWAPYRDGRWSYIAPWGWTWIDAMPWGYAPYHYGRWAHTHRGWGWIPGPRYARPIYAPALVAFVGGGGFSVGIGSGPIGWFPLGPGEIYNPWYRSSRDYYRRVNVTNIRVTRRYTNTTIINNINNHYSHYRDNRPLRDVRYANRNVPGAFSAMPGREFAAGQRVQRHLVQVDPGRLASARVMPRGVDVRPQPGARAGQRSAHVQQLPLNGFRREVVARHAPPARIDRGTEAAGNAAGSRRDLAPRSNVRVLDARADAAAARRPAAAGRTDAAVEPTRQPRGATMMAPTRDRGEAAEPARQRGLPSARFAHPAERERTEQRAAMPRPGVSYISGANEDARRAAARPDASLPQAPQIRRAESFERPAASGEQRSRAPVNSPRFNPVERESRPSRMQRTEPVTRSDVREEARPQPMSNEPPRQFTPQPRVERRFPQPAYVQPSYRQPPRAAPVPRAEAPRPQRSEPPAERKAEPRRQKDEYQH